MGNILNIRVIAQTLNEEEVGKAWPGLCALVWPEWSARLQLCTPSMKKLLGSKQGPAQGSKQDSALCWTLGPSPVEKALGKRRHGVAELAEGLCDLLCMGLAMGSLPERVAEALREPGDKIAEALKGLNAALAAWNPTEANVMSNTLELALDLAERTLTKALNNEQSSS
ncbi:MAG: hypothetical protein LBV80_01155 [Deltaproteobacteria bacterium]|jgi:hypothetical protein|nr:hypothetical protein [Deltaproteobacteria bacterium]